MDNEGEEGRMKVLDSMSLNTCSKRGRRMKDEWKKRSRRMKVIFGWVFSP